jgi:outer membrane protein TolC
MKHLFLLPVFIIAFLSPGKAQVKSLDAYLAEGLKNNPQIRDLSNQVQSNSVDSLLVHAGHMPQVKFNGLIYYAPVVNGFGYAEPITNISNLTSVVSVSQNIFVKKTLEAQYRKLGLTSQSVRNAQRITQYDLTKAITSQYLTVYGISEDIRYNRELFSSLKEEEEILSRLVKGGVYRQTDYLSFLVELQSMELALNDLTIGFNREYGTLNQLCGITDTTTWLLSFPELSPLNPAAKENSPFFRKFRIDSLQLINEKTLIDRNYKPVVSWFSDAGMINNDPSVIYKNFGLSLGMSLSLPIYDGNQRKLSYRKLQLDEDTRRGYQDYFSRQYDSQLIRLNDELRRTQALIPGMKKQLATAESIIRMEKELLNAGSVSVTDYILALRNLVTIRQNLVQNQVKVQQVINEIRYWQQTQ